MSNVDQQIRWRRIWRKSWRAAVALIVISSFLDHAGAFGYRGDDWQRFDRKQVRVLHVIDDQSFEIDGGTSVRLLGVSANRERATSDSESNLKDRNVTLRLDVPQTRDAGGELLAIVYLSPTDCWNLDLVRDGVADVDRQIPCSIMGQLLATESARNKAAYRVAHKSHS
jgi:hypothetical protein